MRILYDLTAAQREPTCVKPEDSIAKAVTLMTLHRFSQIPVMGNNKQCQGYVSWQSITLKQMVYPGKKLNAKHCCLPVQILPFDTEIRDAIYHILKYDFVMVKYQGKILGPVTLFDLSQEYNRITLPFFYLREIEVDLRKMIEQIIPADEIKSQAGTDAVTDLNFSEYVSNLSHSAIKGIVQQHFDWSQITNALEEIRKLRNDVMHFKKEIQVADSEKLHDYARFFQHLSSVVIGNTKG